MLRLRPFLPRSWRRSPAAAERFALAPLKAARRSAQSLRRPRACFASGLPDEKQWRAWFDLTILRDGHTSLALASAGGLEIILIFVETVLNLTWRSGEGVRGDLSVRVLCSRCRAARPLALRQARRA